MYLAARSSFRAAVSFELPNAMANAVGIRVVRALWLPRSTGCHRFAELNVTNTTTSDNSASTAGRIWSSYYTLNIKNSIITGEIGTVTNLAPT